MRVHTPPLDDVPARTTTFPCPECHEFIAVGAETCRHCGSLVDAEQARRLHSEHQLVTQAVAGANNVKVSIGVAAFMMVVCPVLLLSGERYVYVFTMVCAAVAFGAISTTREWLKQAGSLSTDDGDLPEALRSTRLAYRLWIVLAGWLVLCLISFALLRGTAVGLGRPN